MALFRKLFFRKPPDGLLEISERVYVFDCCFTTDAWEDEDYKVYMGGIISQLRDYYPDASILVFNFRDGGTKSQISNVLSEYDMTIMDYPRHYEGCPLLPMEVIHHFLRSSESWLSLGQQNVLLMHCERGGWPVLAFMLAALLIYRKQYTGEQRTLDMIYKQAPRELLHLLSPLNPLPSQIRYLQYVSRRNVASEWPPLVRVLTLDCVMIRLIPNFDGEGGCRPTFRIYGQDPFVPDQSPKVLFSTPKRSKIVRNYKQAECELVKIDINCRIQGDVVLECISLNDDMEREEMMFRVMFNTAFIRSNILIVNRDEIDILWDAKDQFPKDFRAEVLFSEMDAAASVVPLELSCFEEKEGLPVEAFAKVQEIFNSAEWLSPKADAALNVLQQLTASTITQEKLDSPSYRNLETSTLLHELFPEKFVEKQIPSALVDNIKSATDLVLEDQSMLSPGTSPDADLSKEKTEVQLQTGIISPPTPPLSSPLQPSSSPCATEPIASPPPPPTLPLHHLLTSKPIHNSEGKPLLVHPSPASQTTSSVTTFNNLISGPPSATRALPDAASIASLPLLPSEEKPATGTRPPPPPPPPPTLTLKDMSICSGRPSLPTPPPLPAQPTKGSVAISTGPPPPPPPPPCPASTLKDLGIGSGLPSLPTPPPPPTQPTKENRAIRTGPPPPPPPPPALPLKEDSAIRAGPPPPPPPPAPPLCPPLMDKSAITAGCPPPPPPPMPFHFGQVAEITISSPVPPPPPPPALSSSSKYLDPELQNSSNAPPAPPPPVLSNKGHVKIDGVSKLPPSTSSNGNPPPTPAPLFSSPPSAKGRLSRSLSSKAHQSKKLKPLHWLKINRAVQGSLWADAQKMGEASKAPEIDMSELESLFSVAVPNPDQKASGGKSNSRVSLGQKPEKVQLIEHRRAYNCEIMLSQVKIPLHDLVSSVLALEDSAIDVDQVDNLIKFCPTKEEMEVLKGYNGEKEKLGKCERFFLELIQVPRMESKLRVFSFKIQFRSQVSELRDSLNVVNSAADQIRNSIKLKRVMQTILSLGNALNQGTARGSAVGFKLDSLLKLTETRARNNKMTLMHYLCKVLADKLPELLDFSKDLASLDSASKIQLKFLAEEMQAISKGLEKIVQELSLSENDGPVSEEFRKVLKNFLCFAEAEVRSLASLYSGVGRNVDALIIYFGEDPSRCPFEQVISTLFNFVKMFNRAHEENCKQLELQKKKEEKDAENEKLKIHTSQDSEHWPRTPIKSVK